MRGDDGLGGPLDMILSDQQLLKTFSKVPLVMDLLSSKFMLGLPDLNDTQGVLRNADQLNYLRRMCTDGKTNGLVLDDAVGALLQAAEAEDSSMTFLPGAQFIVAGVVSSPSSYYKVPAMRMALDFVVYIATVAVLSYFVFFHTAALNAFMSGWSISGGTRDAERRPQVPQRPVERPGRARHAVLVRRLGLQMG